MFVAFRRQLAAIVMVACALAGLSASSAWAEGYSVKTLHFKVITGPDDQNTCDIVGDLYKPDSATKAHPAPAILTTNGFGGSKNDQATEGRFYASQGYVVLSYSGLGFGNSGCKITLDDPDYDGKAGSQLLSFLGGTKAAKDGTKIDYIVKDSPGDPRVGMIGGSYGGPDQFPNAGPDRRLDAVLPQITWND